MNNILVLILSLVFINCSLKYKNESKNSLDAMKPNVVFTLTEGISHPESVIHDEFNNVIYVSNVASGNPVETKRVGHIGKYTIEGKLINSHWIKGLKAPKGMAISGNYLYVSDVNEVVKINIRNEKIFSVKNAKFLNDVVVDKNGIVYISDMMTDKIHFIEKNEIKVWLNSPDLRSPNGLFTDGKKHLLFTSWGNPINPETFKTEKLGFLGYVLFGQQKSEIVQTDSLQGNLDGITSDNEGNLWISDWMSGDIYKVKKTGHSQRVYNFSKGCADIFYAKKLELLFVPQMNESKVYVVRIDK